MQMNKVMKSFIIALPVVTMMACSSGPSEEELAAERNRLAQEQAAAEAEAREAEAERVQAEAAQRLKRQEEMVQQEMEALKNEQTVYFDFDRSSIKPEFQRILDKHAAFLVKNPSTKVTIEGHTDSVGSDQLNQKLSEERANSVRDFLIDKGIDSARLSAIGYGEEKPIATNNTRAGRAQNRRVEINLVK